MNVDIIIVRICDRILVFGGVRRQEEREDQLLSRVPVG